MPSCRNRLSYVPSAYQAPSFSASPAMTKSLMLSSCPVGAVVAAVPAAGVLAVGARELQTSYDESDGLQPHRLTHHLTCATVASSGSSTWFAATRLTRPAHRELAPSALSCRTTDTTSAEPKISAVRMAVVKVFMPAPRRARRGA